MQRKKINILKYKFRISKIVSNVYISKTVSMINVQIILEFTPKPFPSIKVCRFGGYIFNPRNIDGFLDTGNSGKLATFTHKKMISITVSIVFLYSQCFHICKRFLSIFTVIQITYIYIFLQQDLTLVVFIFLSDLYVKFLFLRNISSI